MAAPSERSHTNVTDSGTSFSVAMPAGFQAGDIMVLSVGQWNFTAPAAPNSGLTGWTRIGTGQGPFFTNSGQQIRGDTYYRIADGSETTLTVGTAASTFINIILTAWKDATGIDAASTDGSVAATATPVATSIVTTAANEVIAYTVYIYDGGGSITNLDSGTQINHQSGTSGTPDDYIVTKPQASPGATSWHPTFAGSSNGSVMFATVGLIGAPGPPQILLPMSVSPALRGR